MRLKVKAAQTQTPLTIAQELAKSLSLNGGIPAYKDYQLNLAKKLVNALTPTASARTAITIDQVKTKYAILDDKGEVIKQLVNEKQALLAFERGQIVVERKKGEWVSYLG